MRPSVSAPAGAAARSGIRSRRARPTAARCGRHAACTIDAQIERPRPRPSCFEVVSGSNRRAASAAVDAGAVVDDADLDRDRHAGSAAMRTMPSRAARSAMASMALRTRLRITCCSWMRSPYSGGSSVGDVELDRDRCWPRRPPGRAPARHRSMPLTSIVLTCGWPRRRNSRMRRTTPPA